jgi:hypothetical protein
MAFRFSQLAVVGLPIVVFSCSGGDDRNFGNQDAGAGTGGASGSAGKGSGGTSGTSGGTSGAAGTDGASGTSGAAGTGGSSGTADSGDDAGTPCTQQSECDDGESCSGTEACTGGYCKAGTAQADGAECTPIGGEPDGSAAEYICSKGRCVGKCAVDQDCEDNDVCTGKEICDPTSHTCIRGTPSPCDDQDACTDNQCDPVTGCFYPLIDGDLDGHAAETLGACGDDCDDNDKTIFGGAAELCDNKDNNCNDTTDELAPTWYVDCDGDGFAATAAPNTQVCTKPSAPHASCGGTGAWTATPPTLGTTDCWDKDPKAHPFSAAQNSNAWQTGHIPGFPNVTYDDDWNCDGTEEKYYTDHYVTGQSVSCTSGFCGITTILPSEGAGGTSGEDEQTAAAAGSGGSGGIIPLPCCGKAYYTSTTKVAECGTSATYSVCERVDGTCTRYNVSQPQKCR